MSQDASRPRGGMRPTVWLALASLAIHLLVNGGYDFFRDELYFIVCGRHPAWGYVDQPPLVPLIAAAAHVLFGDWLTGFRLVPALAMTATVALSAEFARILGGGRFAQWLSGLCVLGAGIFLIHGLLLSTDMFQALTWLGCSWCIVRLVQTSDQRWWIAFGLIAGLSLLTKYLILFYIAALAPGLLLSPLRRSLTRPWIYAGAGLALLIVLPNLLWQQQQGWPFLELGKAGASHKNLPLSPLGFFVQQLLLVGPLAAPVWLAGLWATAIRPGHAAWRAFPIAYLLLTVFFVASHGKAYYLAPIYPVLLGFGAVALEGWLTRRWMRATALAGVTASSVLLAPMTIPVLPVEGYIAYARALGLSPAALAGEKKRLSQLPQHFADMFGWREMAAQVGAVYRGLPPQERRRAAIFAQNYGEAGAIDVFGHGLPPALSGHNNYYLWGPRGHDGAVMIVVGGDRQEMERLFDSVTPVARLDSAYAMPYEAALPIYVLRGAKVPLPELWPRLKHFD